MLVLMFKDVDHPSAENLNILSAKSLQDKSRHIFLFGNFWDCFGVENVGVDFVLGKLCD